MDIHAYEVARLFATISQPHSEAEEQIIAPIFPIAQIITTVLERMKLIKQKN